MKKIIQREISEDYCDFTNEKFELYDRGGKLELNLLFSTVDGDEEMCLNFDLSEKVCIELFEFLKKKYPKQINKKLANVLNCGLKNVVSLKLVKK